MSETLMLEPEWEVTEASVNHEVQDPTWGDGLMNLVLDNQFVIVRCPWMGGAEVTLGEAMTAYSYPPNMTERDVPTVMSVVNELLAYRVENNSDEEQTEEEESESKKEEAINKKDDVKLEKVTPSTSGESKFKSKTLNNTKDPKEQPNREPAVTVQSTLESRDTNLSSGEMDITTKSPSAIGLTTEVQKGAPYDKNFKNKTSPNHPEVTEPVSSVEIVSKNLAQESSVEFVESEPTSTVVEDIDESTELLLSSEEGNSVDTEIELADEAPGIFTYENYFEDDRTVELVKEDVLPNPFIGFELDSDDQYLEIEHEFQNYVEVENEEFVLQPGIAAHQPEQIETFVDEQLDDHHDIESLLTQLLESIEQVDPELAETANVLLDKINHAPTKLEMDNEGNLINDAEVERELKEFFSELFDQLEIEYSTETIELLVQLTVKEHFSYSAEIPNDEEPDEVQQDTGTHEIIKKILAGLGDTRKSMLNAYALGKSAIQLYCYDFPTELRKRIAA